jgi:tetratricopeptide (TPR) repeat protein
MGDYQAAVQLWERARQDAVDQQNTGFAAAIERRLGLACFWTGRLSEALEHYDAGLQWARAGNDALEARLRIARGICLQEMGRTAEAKAEAAIALDCVDENDPATLLACTVRFYNSISGLDRRTSRVSTAFALRSWRPGLAIPRWHSRFSGRLLFWRDSQPTHRASIRTSRKRNASRINSARLCCRPGRQKLQSKLPLRAGSGTPGSL